MKKIISLLLILCVILSCGVICASAAKVTAFEDDFNNGIVEWKDFGYAYPTVTFEPYAEGENNVGRIYGLQVGGQGVRIHSVTTGQLETNDYEYSGRMKFDSGNEYVYILFRTESTDRFYGIWYDRYYNVLRLIKNNYVSAVDGMSVSTSAAGVSMNVWFNYKIAVSGNKMDIYINYMTKPIMSYTDENDPILTGGVGAGLYTGQPGVKNVYIDDILVTYDDGSTETYYGGKKTPRDIAETSYEEAAMLLMNLGIMNEYSENAFSGETYMTRAEIADIAVKSVNMQSEIPVTKNPAADVPKSHKYAKAIRDAMEMGVMSSYEAFRPDDAITFEEAVTVCVRLLGYEPMTSIKGDYSSGYISVANSIGLLNGVNAQRGYVMTRESIARLFLNTLNAPMMRAQTFGKGITYEQNDKVTLLSEYFHIFSDSGVLEATEFSALKLKNTAGEKRVIINGEEYKTALSNAEKFFGLNVRYYWYDYDGQKYIVYALPYKNKILTADAEDILSFNNNTYTYETNKKKKTVSFSVTDTDVIYNGKSMQGSKYIPDNGYIRLTDNNSDGKYDVLEIKDYRNVIADTVNTTDGIIADKRTKENNIYLKQNGEDISVNAVNANGKTQKIAKIYQDSVVSAAISEDGKYAELIVNTAKITGEITTVNSTKKEIFINGKAYKCTADFENFADAEPGKQVQVYLDYNGKIAYMKTADGAGVSYAYILDKKLENKFGSELKVKAYSASSNSMEEFLTAQSVTVDGTKITGFDKVENKIKSGVCVLGFNGKNEIIKIDYPYSNAPEAGESAESLRKIAGSSTEKVRFKDWNQFYNLFTISNSTTVMTVPIDLTQEEMFSSGGISGRYQNDGGYYVTAYSLKSESYNADLLVEYINVRADDNTAAVVIKDKSVGVNSDGDKTEIITVLQTDGNERKYFVNTDYITSEAKANIDAVDFGDIVTFAVTRDGEILDVASIVYDCSENKANNMGVEEDLNYKWRSLNGYIYSVDGSTIVANRKVSPTGEAQKFDVSVNDGAVYMVDLKAREIKTADLSEFNTFKLYGTEATPIILLQYYLQNRLLVGYKK